MAKYYGGQPIRKDKGKDGWPDPPPMPPLPQKAPEDVFGTLGVPDTSEAGTEDERADAPEETEPQELEESQLPEVEPESDTPTQDALPDVPAESSAPKMPALPQVPVDIERVRGATDTSDTARMLEEISAKLDEVLTSVNREQEDDRIARM